MRDIITSVLELVGLASFAVGTAILTAAWVGWFMFGAVCVVAGVVEGGRR